MGNHNKKHLEYFYVIVIFLLFILIFAIAYIYTQGIGVRAQIRDSNGTKYTCRKSGIQFGTGKSGQMYALVPIAKK